MREKRHGRVVREKRHGRVERERVIFFLRYRVVCVREMRNGMGRDRESVRHVVCEKREKRTAYSMRRC